MSELVVVATFKYKPDKLDEAKELLKWLADETHSKEEGALLYAFHEDRSDPNTITVIERWASQEVFDAHGKTEHIAKVVAALPDLIAEPPVISILSPLGYGDPKKGVLA